MLFRTTIIHNNQPSTHHPQIVVDSTQTLLHPPSLILYYPLLHLPLTKPFANKTTMPHFLHKNFSLPYLTFLPLHTSYLKLQYISNTLANLGNSVEKCIYYLFNLKVIIVDIHQQNLEI